MSRNFRHYVRPWWIQRILRLENSGFIGTRASLIHSDFSKTFSIFFANWDVPEKVRWSSLIPMCQLVMFVLSTKPVFNWHRWFVSWLTVNADFPSADLTIGVKIITLQSGTWSLTNFFKFSNRSKISLAVNLLVSFFPTWIVKWLGFFSIIGMRLRRISSTFAPRKFRTFTTCFFLRNLSSKNPFMIESPAITIVFLRYKSWLLLVLSFHE